MAGAVVARVAAGQQGPVGTSRGTSASEAFARAGCERSPGGNGLDPLQRPMRWIFGIAAVLAAALIVSLAGAARRLVLRPDRRVGRRRVRAVDGRVVYRPLLRGVVANEHVGGAAVPAAGRRGLSLLGARRRRTDPGVTRGSHPAHARRLPTCSSSASSPSASWVSPCSSSGATGTRWCPLAGRAGGRARRGRPLGCVRGGRGDQHHGWEPAGDRDAPGVSPRRRPAAARSPSEASPSFPAASGRSSPSSASHWPSNAVGDSFNLLQPDEPVRLHQQRCGLAGRADPAGPGDLGAPGQHREPGHGQGGRIRLARLRGRHRRHHPVRRQLRAHGKAGHRAGHRHPPGGRRPARPHGPGGPLRSRRPGSGR